MINQIAVKVIDLENNLNELDDIITELKCNIILYGGGRKLNMKEKVSSKENALFSAEDATTKLENLIAEMQLETQKLQNLIGRM